MLKIMYIFIAIALFTGLVGLMFDRRADVPATQIVVPKEKVAIMCTADAMQCPDGSFVGRTGDKCEFVCPKVDDQTASSTQNDKVRVENPAPGAIVTSPLSVTGSALGSWFFEGMFPIELQDASGTVLMQSGATAVGEWTISDFVPFAATIDFTIPADSLAKKTGKLILKKDNPSGMSENDDRVEVPIRFAP